MAASILGKDLSGNWGRSAHVKHEQFAMLTNSYPFMYGVAEDMWEVFCKLITWHEKVLKSYIKSPKLYMFLYFLKEGSHMFTKCAPLIMDNQTFYMGKSATIL